MGTVDPTVSASAPMQISDNQLIKSEPNGEICFRGKRYRVIYCKNDGSPNQLLTDQKVIDNVISVLVALSKTIIPVLLTQGIVIKFCWPFS